MTGYTGICFSPSLPVLKRPRSIGPLIPLPRLRYRKRCFGAESQIHFRCRPLVAMASKDSIATPDLVAPAEHVLPSGAFTVLLKVKFRDGITLWDQKSILLEYGRKTCAEEGVLRCDILYEVTSRNLPKNKFYELWITFADALAYTEHERSSHASRLRLCLENPSGGDNSVMLTKLAYGISLLKPVRPDIPSWRSAIDYSNEATKVNDKTPVGLSLSRASDSVDSQSSANVRQSLNMLMSSVGLENVTILIATATAKCNDSASELRAACEDYLADLENSAGVVRTGLLIRKNDPYNITLLTVHDANDKDGACFDMELGIDFVTEEEWKLRRCLAVFPGKGGWELRVNENDASSIATEEISVLSPRKTRHISQAPARIIEQGDTDSNKLQKISRREMVSSDQPEPQSSKLRLLQGAGAFDSIKHYLREMTRLPTGDLRAMIIYGWNTSRIHDLIVQLEYDRRKDPGVIEFTIDVNVRSMDVTTGRLKRGVEEVRRFRPDVVIGYGGGSVMDMAKAIAHLGNAEDEDVEEFAKLIDSADEEGKDEVSVTKTCLSVPVMLIPTTIGSGSELTEPCIFSARTRDRRWRRIPVHFCDAPETVRPFADRTVLVDSRLVMPKRLDGFHASQGALQLACLGIDVLISGYEHVEEQYIGFALEGISLSFKGVISALREPFRSTGQSRDALLNAKTAIGLARDGIGRMGLCVRLTLGVIDSLIDGRYPTMFRMVLVRVTAAVLSELYRMQDGYDGREELLCSLCNVLKVGEVDGIVKKLLSKAEDCNVLLLKELGMVRRRIPDIARYVAHSFTKPECSMLERKFADPARIERVLISAMNQEYEL